MRDRVIDDDGLWRITRGCYRTHDTDGLLAPSASFTVTKNVGGRAINDPVSVTQRLHRFGCDGGGVWLSLNEAIKRHISTDDLGAIERQFGLQLFDARHLSVQLLFFAGILSLLPGYEAGHISLASLLHNHLFFLLA